VEKPTVEAGRHSFTVSQVLAVRAGAPRGKADCRGRTSQSHSFTARNWVL